MFRKILFEIIKTSNQKNIKSFETLQRLKGKNIFDTFLNIKASEDLYKLQKEVKSLKKTFAKHDKYLPKEEIKKLSKKQKAINEELRLPFYQAIENAKLKPRAEQKVAIREISQNIFEERLKLKKEQGKTISNLDILELNNPKLRKFNKFVKNKIYASGIMTLTCISDIKDANDNLGIGAAAEEIGKTTATCFIGLSTLKYVNTQLKNVIATTSIYCPGGRFLKGLTLPLAILSSIVVKPIIDKCWMTEYEKFLIDNDGFNAKVSTTADVYSHSIQKADVEASDTLADMFLRKEKIS